jgi:hypothetical protein
MSTLREVRRYLGRSARRCHAGEWFQSWRLSELGWTCHTVLTVRAVDRAISRLGPDWPSVADTKAVARQAARRAHRSAARQEPLAPGEFRPKGTDEVGACTGAGDGAIHGGDGNSGECAGPAQTAASEPRDPTYASAATAAQASSTSRTQGAPGSTQATADKDSVAEGSENAGRESAAEASYGEPTAGGVEPAVLAQGHPADPRGADPSAADTPGESLGGARAATDPGLVEDHAIKAEGGPVTSADPAATGAAREANPREASGDSPSSGSRQPRRSHGGRHADPVRAQAAAKADRRTAARAARLLERLFDALDVGAGVEPSPRRDPRKLVRELAVKRVALSRCKREEMAPALRVLAVDWSGSCSSYCDELLTGALAISDADDSVVVVGHSNGYVEQAWGRRVADLGIRERERPQHELPVDIRAGWHDHTDWWRALVARAQARSVRIAGLIALGDWDAMECYQAWRSAGGSIAFLDNFSASIGARPCAKRDCDGCRLGTHVIGVGGKALLDGLRVATRRQKG